MNLNNSILVLLGFVSGIMLLPTLNTQNILLLIVLIIIGFEISRNYLISVSFGFIITYIMTMIYTSVPFTMESFKSKQKKEHIEIDLDDTIFNTVTSLKTSQMEIFIEKLHKMKPFLQKGQELLNLFNKGGKLN